MNDLISRQAAIDRAVSIPMFGRDIKMVAVSEIENLPSAQPDVPDIDDGDMISRKAAIDALHMHLMYRMGTDSNKKRLDDWINSLPSAQPEKRTEERTETHACDLIDREAAVDAIYHHLPSVSRTRARTMLHEVPSAQPEIIRCKDCKYHGCNTCGHKLGLIAALDNHYCSYAERRES